MKAYFINKVLATTVVGSYPVVKGSGIKAIFDPLKPAVETAVADQLAAGIDIISDGQVRGDMIQAFSGKLPGIKGQNVVGKVQPASGAITAADTKYARSKSPYVKGIITGPSTLAHGLHISTPMYRNGRSLRSILRRPLPQRPGISKRQAPRSSRSTSRSSRPGSPTLP